MTSQPTETQPITLRGIRFYPFDSVDSLIDHAVRHKGLLIALNAEKFLNATDRTRAIINANTGYADGYGTVRAAHQKGATSTIRIPGCELWLHFIERFHATDRTFYFVGATPEVHLHTMERLEREYPDLKIAGHRDGYIRTDDERRELINDIARTKPDFVFVAMGSPKQELLMADMQSVHPHAVYQGLGGSFDVYTGNVRRAPQWWLDHNMEFVYRLIRQPKRIKRDIKRVRFFWWLVRKKF